MFFKKDKIKIQIKSIFGGVLFEYECEDNTIAKTVTEAVKSSADLSSADLSSANHLFILLKNPQASSLQNM